MPILAARRPQASAIHEQVRPAGGGLACVAGEEILPLKHVGGTAYMGGRPRTRVP